MCIACVNLAYPLPGLFCVGTRYGRWKLLMKIIAREKKVRSVKVKFLLIFFLSFRPQNLGEILFFQLQPSLSEPSIVYDTEKRFTNYVTV